MVSTSLHRSDRKHVKAELKTGRSCHLLKRLYVLHGPCSIVHKSKDKFGANLDVGIKGVGPKDGAGALVALHAILFNRGDVA